MIPLKPFRASYGSLPNLEAAKTKNRIAQMENPQSESEVVLIFGKEVPESFSWVFKYRIPDVCVMLLLFLLSYNGVFTPSANKISPPEVTVSVDGLDVPVVVEDAEHSFPLKVDGEWCSASDFKACSGSSQTTGCCADQDFWEEVTETELLLIAYVIPLIFVFLRGIFLRFVLKKRKIDFMNCIVGLLGSWVLLQFGTDTLKYFVGYPRPNYYALVAYADLHGSDGVLGFANRSFPSGHSSESMTGMAFITFMLLDDIKAFSFSYQSFTRSLSIFLYFLAILPMVLAIWVGATRIRDYFHFPADVLAGLLIGVGASYYGSQYFGKHTFFLQRIRNSTESAHLLSSPLLDSNLFKV